MGNVVSGSCLRLGGGHEWATITNALDVNKRVLYAENEKGAILGRRLITMSDQGHILQYTVYNNTPEIDLDTLFEKFTLELAQRCNAKVANDGEVSVLVGEDWEAGTSIESFKLSMRDIAEKKTLPPRPGFVPSLQPTS